MLSLLLVLFACSSPEVPCGAERCSSDAVCVIQLRSDGTERAECQTAPGSCAEVYSGGSCADDGAVSPTCQSEAGDLCPSVLPDASGFTCSQGPGYDYLEVSCEDR